MGLSVVDRFTYTTQHFFQGLKLSSNKTLRDWYSSLTHREIHSTIETRCAAAARHRTGGAWWALRVGAQKSVVRVRCQSVGPCIVR